MFSDPKALSCTPCGQGIQSEPRDLDENPLAVNGSLVRATSASCCESPIRASNLHHGFNLVLFLIVLLVQ